MAGVLYVLLENYIFHSSIARDCSILHDPTFIQVSLGIAHLIICTTLFWFKYRSLRMIHTYSLILTQI